MHLARLLLACTVLPLLRHAVAESDQKPLAVDSGPGPGRKLQGRFLQITDIHPDPFYTVHSDTDAVSACHRGHGQAGYYGAENSDCDAPFSLINATFQWIEENLKDTIDFIIWTGDSARHDNDENYPRSEDQVMRLNKLLVDKFVEVFGRENADGCRNSAFQVPIIPTFGNNDILPHNIFTKGPNLWTKRYAQLWRDIIPEEQRHAFERGGWFYVEVIPDKLAVFSLNTLYFFDSNSAVDGCASRSEPGYEHMEWLRIQLSFLRQRGMKAILSGHVPPARSREKSLWDESCWQKYAIWLKQYRDVIVGSVYGHMNVEHFILQDFYDIDYGIAAGVNSGKSLRQAEVKASESLDDVGTLINAPNYINSLRQIWAKLPNIPPSLRSNFSNLEDASKRERISKEQRDFFDEVGGEFAERFSVSVVAASVVPNYFPALRVYEYNITGLEDLGLETGIQDDERSLNADSSLQMGRHDPAVSWAAVDSEKPSAGRKKAHFIVPDPPSKRSPPGPAYSPQTFSWLSYTQYFANLTYIYGDVDRTTRGNQATRGRHYDPRNFSFEVEYDTRNERDVYPLKHGLMVTEWVNLAATVGDWTPKMDEAVSDFDSGEEHDKARSVSGSDFADEFVEQSEFEIGEEADDMEFVQASDSDADEAHIEKKKKKKKTKHPGKSRAREIVETWYAFTSRAVVGTLNRGELKEKFG